MRTRSVLVALLVVLSISIAALQSVSEAGPVTFDFTGHVTFVADPFHFVGSLIEAGDPVLASLRYDTATPDSIADPRRGIYVGPGWIKIRINALAFEQVSGVTVVVSDNAHVEEAQFQDGVTASSLSSFTAWPSQLPTFSHSTLDMECLQPTPPGSLLSSDVLPTSLDFAKAACSGFVGAVMFPNGPFAYVATFVLSPVPEPATLLLFGTTVAGLGLARWRQRRQK